MGQSQSSFNGQEPSRTIIIDEWEIPEAYKSVGVSEEVVTMLNKKPKVKASAKAPVKESVKAPVKESVKAPVKAPTKTSVKAPSLPEPARLPPIDVPELPTARSYESLEELEEKKRVFEDTVNRIENQYFGHQINNKNAYSDVEKQLIRCLNANKSAVLNCQSYLEALPKVK